MIIFLYGPDTYRSHEKLSEFIEKFKRKRDAKGLSIIRIESSDLTIDKFRQSVLSPGLFAAKRLIVIENLLSQNKDPYLIKEVINFLKKDKKEESDNIVIFWEEEKNTLNDEERKLFNLLKGVKYAQKFNFLETDELCRWIEKEVKKRKGIIEKEAVNLLIDYIGSDLWRMSQELDKLMAYCQKKLSCQDIKLLVEANEEENIFSLVDALIAKNKKRAVELLEKELAKGTFFTQIIGSLAYQFRLLLQLKETRSANFYQLAKELGAHPFSVKKAIFQVKKYQPEELKKIYQELLKIDLQLKTTGLKPEILFDLLIAKL